MVLDMMQAMKYKCRVASHFSDQIVLRQQIFVILLTLKLSEATTETTKKESKILFHF